MIASGEGWAISDVICSAGPHDRPYEEAHRSPCIAVVVSGTFQYRSGRQVDLMAPGSVLLGNASDCFTCSHEHGAGDRCVSFSYAPAWFESVSRGARFRGSSLPPIRVTAPIVARAAALLVSSQQGACEEVAIQLAACILKLEGAMKREDCGGLPAPLARLSRVIRHIENETAAPTDLASLARLARLSPYHFLRNFQLLTGVTPHQYLLRARLRRAAVRLLSERHNIAEIAFDCGFGDLSSFNRAFKHEFGMTPRRTGAPADSDAPRTDCGSCGYRDRFLIVRGGKINPGRAPGLPPPDWSASCISHPALAVKSIAFLAPCPVL